MFNLSQHELLLAMPIRTQRVDADAPAESVAGIIADNPLIAPNTN
ncbi:hypothetical protein [Rhizobium leguminosarum]|nr:hypothetical protein [Rhizobium leguminosarum]